MKGQGVARKSSGPVKIKMAELRVLLSSTGLALLRIIDRRGAVTDVELEAGYLPQLAQLLAESSEKASIPVTSAALGERARWSTRDRLPPIARAKSLPARGPHGGFEFGTSADLSQVAISIHVPALGAVDVVMSLAEAREILGNLAKVVALVAEHGADSL